MVAYTPDIELVQSHVATYHIYVLKHPVTNEIFYVGKTTKDLRTRLSGHLSDSGDGSEKGTYIKTIFETGEKPIIEAVETLHGTCYLDKMKFSEREYYWMKYFKDKGCPLTNRIGLEENAGSNEYQAYLKTVARRETSWHYYYVGKTKFGVEVYDEERINEDGFTMPEDKGSMNPTVEHHSLHIPKLTYHPCYDDEHKDYIKASQEEM